VDPGTIDEVQSTTYTPATIRKTEDMPMSNYGRCQSFRLEYQDRCTTGPFLYTHIAQPHPSSLPKRGVGMGVGWAYDPGKGPPKTRAGHVLPPQCGGNSNHPYEDNAKSTWQTSKTGKTRPTARAPQPPNPSGSPVEVFDLIALWTHNYLWE